MLFTILLILFYFILPPHFQIHLLLLHLILSLYLMYLHFGLLLPRLLPHLLLNFVKHFQNLTLLNLTLSFTALHPLNYI